MNVKVSVIIPTYNRAKFICETLDSVLAQTFKDWECIVVDDGSTDNTDQVIAEYLNKDFRFKYFKRPPDRVKGGCTCRNIGLEQSEGEYIQFLDSDDLISINKLEEQIRVLEIAGPSTIATCKWGGFSDSSKLTVKSYRPTYISTNTVLDLFYSFGKHSTYLPSHTYLVSKKVISKAGNWNESLKNNQDGEFFSRVLLQCSKVIFVSSAEVYYRNGAKNRVSTLSDIGKIKSLVLSWKLIDEAIYTKYGIENHLYVKQAKNSVYNKIKSTYPAVVEENNNFFNSRYSRIEFFCLKVIARLEMFYNSRTRKANSIKC